ncbi:MAG: glucoamylase family protein, partial [Bacillota bacterium]|nr:glucoamylase family protein [Bacillota bacterium]
ALITDEASCKKLAGLLNEYIMSNTDAGKNAGFGLLLDLKDGKNEREEQDEKIMDAARKAVAGISPQGKNIYLFVRRRTFNRSDGIYMGYERKRGAISELVTKIKGKNSGILVLKGDEENLKTYRFLVTLDADTRPEPESIRALAGTMLHPLIRPEIDGKNLTVVRGHGILQPGVVPSLDAANRSLFASVYAGVGGVDPYGSAISDVYQDLFSEGIYTGKGMIDIDAFDRVFDGRFPDNRILSHDLLEGIYLRAGFVSDIQFTDGFPFKVSSYFTRMHRWTRGDFQISPWLLRKVRNQKGEKADNPINIQGKWKIFDNLRRSLTPFILCTILVLGSLLSLQLFISCVVIALLSIMMPLISDMAVVLFRGDGMRKYHSNILTGVPANAMHTLLELMFLPHQAIIGLGASITALYRINVSKKHLLQWVTADQADQRNVSAVRYHRLMLPSVLLGLFLILEGNGIQSIILGLLWIASPQAGFMISTERKRQVKISDTDRAFLKREAAFIFKYFEDFLTPEDHYLPPDNYQEQPPVGLARRTSPTNIGLCVLCVLSAKDLGFIDEGKALFLLDKIIGSIEKLDKWNGHLYNWYDTKKAKPLHPKCVSSVDSGNLLACLIASKEALSEFEKEKKDGIMERIEKLASAIDLRPLYDKKRKLFYISIDTDSGRTSGGVYDLMASEARILSYVAVASGQVPKKHWERLGRGLTELNRYRGMLSWTGTMFEYLMPNLLIPAYPNSLLYESMQFAVYAQKQNGRKRNTPFGISESAFYAFDNILNYQYKAHGVQKLGLKRGLDREQVVSPYSSFLALSVDHDSAIKNLRRLRDMGMEGSYGFFEACDFTPERLPGKKEYAVVRCFMAHHLGMSLISISNLLSPYSMADRFMRNTRMRAYQTLLCEKIPVGAPVIRMLSKEVPEKPRLGSDGLVREFSGKERNIPVINLLTNGSYRVLMTEDGRSRSESGRMQLTTFSAQDAGIFPGMGFFLKADDKVTSLLKMPFFDGQAAYSGRFETSRASHICKAEGFASIIRTSVMESMDAEVRQVEIKNTSGKRKNFELLVYFEPQVETQQDYAAHPSFSKLFLKTEISGNAVIIRRRPRHGGEEKGIVFCCDTPVTYDTSKEQAMGRGGVRRIMETAGNEAKKTEGAVLDPCVLARVRLNIAP